MTTNITPFHGLTLPQLPESHQRMHDRFLHWMKVMIGNHRKHIGLNPSWVFEYGVHCPRAMPMQEGKIWWNSESHYTHVDLRCDLSPELAEHVLIHELFELAGWETADVFLNTLEWFEEADRKLKEQLLRQFRSARNREIEIQVARYRGRPRPGHLMEEQQMTELSPSSKATRVRVFPDDESN